MKYQKTQTTAHVVEARPMTLGEYNLYRGWIQPPGEDATTPGYLTEAQGTQPNHSDHEGYISWCPKTLFEMQYQAMETPKFAQPHQQQVYEEFLDLDRRIQALDIFIGGAVFTGLRREDQGLLLDQDSTMRKLRSILNIRIHRFT